MKAIAVDRRNQCLDWGGAAKTLKHNAETGDNNPVALIMDNAIHTFENHAQDSRVQDIGDVSPLLGASNANSAGVSGNNPLVVFSKASHARNAAGDGERYAESDVAQTRNTFDQGETRTQEVVVAVGFKPGQSGREDTGSLGVDGFNQTPTGDVSKTLVSGASDYHHVPLVALRYIVRRLTPGECETLMAFPQGWTKIPYRGKPADQCPDSPRYKALGNSWGTNCAEWVLRRIVAAFRLGLI